MPNGMPGDDTIGFGRIPSVQTKVDEGKEFRNITKYVWWMFFIGAGASWLAYVIINAAITEGDWATFIHILMLIPISASCILLSRMWWRRGWLYWESGWTYLAIAVAHGVLFLMLVYAATDLLIFVFQFPGWQSPNLLTSIAAYTAFVVLPIAGGLAFTPMILRAWRETTDVTHGAIEYHRDKLKYRHDKWQWDKEHPRVVSSSNGDGDEQDDREFEFIPRVGAPPRADVGKDERMRLFLDDFFEGMVDGSIGMTTRDWNTGVKLPKSGVPLKTKMAKRARDELIKAGYLELKDPLNELAGVQFAYGYQPEELLDILLSNGDKNGHKNQVRVEGIPSVQTEVKE